MLRGHECEYRKQQKQQILHGVILSYFFHLSLETERRAMGWDGTVPDMTGCDDSELRRYHVSANGGYMVRRRWDSPRSRLEQVSFPAFMGSERPERDVKYGNGMN